jgi:hypothetical protein
MYEQFNDPEFSVFGPSFAISEMPHVPGQVGALGVFEEDGQASTTVKIEREGSVLKIIDPTPRGARARRLVIVDATWSRSRWTISRSTTR